MLAATARLMGFRRNLLAGLFMMNLFRKEYIHENNSCLTNLKASALLLQRTCLFLAMRTESYSRPTVHPAVQSLSASLTAPIKSTEEKKLSSVDTSVATVASTV